MLPALFQTFFQFVLLLSISIYLNWKLSLIIFSIVPLYVFRAYIILNKLNIFDRSMQLQDSKIYGFLTENINGLEEIKANLQEKQQLKKYLRLIKDRLGINV